MEPYIFCDLLSDLSAEFRQNYVDDRETLRIDEIGEKSTRDTESIDEVDLRRKH